MGAPIATLRDSFADNIQADAWSASFVTGSATKAETSGQFRATLPSSTAGTHTAYYRTGTTYDFTGGGFYINIDTMVATGVAAVASFEVSHASGDYVRWIQQSGTLKAQKVLSGVATDLFTVTWSAATHKYLRIRESGGNILFDSSTNGTSWTNRATLALPFTVTDLLVQFGAQCGNIAAPGSFRLEDVNLILPALATTWNWTQIVWPLTYRYKVVTLACDVAGTAQGYVTTADGVNVTGDPTGSVRYWSGPAHGGRMLTEQTSPASAEAMAVDIPLDGRFDLPEIIEARCIRVWHRSIDAASYIMREIYARRLVQSDDIEAESIRAINIAAGAITADKISVRSLSAIVEDVGQLTITNPDGDAWIYQGTGTGTTPTTGLKIFNVGGIGKLSTYNATVEQVTLDTDGVLKAGAGNVLLNADGIQILCGSAGFNTLSWLDSAGGATKGAFSTQYAGGSGSAAQIEALNTVSTEYSRVTVQARDTLTTVQAQLFLNVVKGTVASSIARLQINGVVELSATPGAVTIPNGLNVGTTGAGAGVILASSQITAGDAITSNGANAALVFEDRTGAFPWLWYGTANTARFNFNATTDLLSISSGGIFNFLGASRAILMNNSQVVGNRRTGWTTVPTGTLTRTTFVSDTVTLVELAKRVAALIVDLHAATPAHGLIGP